MMGHSLGAEMAYQVAIKDPSVKALVITGFAYTVAADQRVPRNMLMIIGKWDEFRDRMTPYPGYRKRVDAYRGDPQGHLPPESTDRGDLRAISRMVRPRRVVVPHTIHIQESHSRSAIAESLLWMKQALSPPAAFWINSDQQIWPIKEWATPDSHAGRSVVADTPRVPC